MRLNSSFGIRIIFNLGVFFLLFSVIAQCSWGQSKDNIPVPEYFGIYAVADGHLIKLDAQPVHADKNVTVRLGRRNDVGNVLQGQPVASSTNTQVPELAADLKVVVFSQTGGRQTPLDTAKSLHLERLVFVRNLTVDTGFPNNVRRSGAENGWETGDAPELLGMGNSDRARSLEFLIKPFQGHQDMVVAVLPEKLTPGLYRIRVGEANPFSGSGGLIFAVSPSNEGETMNCVDAAVTYSFNISNSKYTPCGGRAQTAGTTAPQDTSGAISSSGEFDNSSGKTESSCGDYDACFNAGLSAYKVSDWQAATNDFQAAANLRPASGDPWMWLGRIYLRNEQNRDASTAWDKALSLGATIVIGVCHERTLQPCERGDLSLSSKTVSFLVSGSQSVFAAPPSQITAKTVFNNSQMAYASFGLQVGGKSYNFDFLPLGVTCQIQLLVQCPQLGIAQQLIVANYVAQTSPKLAFGALGPAPTAAKPTTGAALALRSNNSACGQAVDAGYSILLQGHLYKVKADGSAGPTQMHLFFDEKDAQVADSNLLQQLATAAWTRENVIISPDARNRSRSVSAILDTSAAIRQYSQVQDALATAMTEAIRVYATKGASALKVVLDLSFDQLKSQVETAPKTLLTLTAQKGLRESLETYQKMEAELPPIDSTVLDSTRLDEIYQLYVVARTLELPYGALAAKLMPTSGGELAQDAFKTLGSGLLSSLPGASVGQKLTLQTLFDLNQSLGSLSDSVPALKSYSENLALALKLSEANRRTISAWSSPSPSGCSGRPGL